MCINKSTGYLLKENCIGFRYLVLQGHPEPQRGRTVSVRPVTQAKVGGDALRFVRSLSYTFAFEFARQGFVFAYQDSVKISVTRLYKVR